MRAFFTAGLWSNESCQHQRMHLECFNFAAPAQMHVGISLIYGRPQHPAFDSLATRIKAINPTNATEITDLVKSLIPAIVFQFSI